MLSRASKPAHRTSIRRPWYQRIGVAAATLALVLVGGTLTATPAYAATGALTINKTVDGADAGNYVPGDEFTYTITVGCDDADCIDAELVDVIPAELAGFAIIGSSVNPPSQPAALELRGCDTVVTEDCAIAASFLAPLDAGGTGIRAGDTYQVTLTLKAPQDLAPSWPSNGTPVTNTAEVTAENASPKTDTATVTVSIPTAIDVAVGKSWSPESQQFLPGAPSTISLDVRNTSNVAAQSLSLQDPTTADDGAADLHASNPFRIVDFTGFGAVTAPEGADRVTVDAYVYNAGSWTWITGTATDIASIALPDGVSAPLVGGLRITFSAVGDTASIVPGGTAGAVQVTVAQREQERNTEASLLSGASVTNEVTGTVTAPGADPVSKTASAPYTIGALDVKVSAGKTITPARIPAGSQTQATITGKNGSNGPLESLTLSDTDYFTENLAFGGFTAPIGYPDGATGASVTWFYSDDSSVEATLANGETPVPAAAPSGEHLTGFAVTFTGEIPAGHTTSIAFSIDAGVGYVPDAGNSPVDADNTVVVTGVNSAGEATADASAPLKVFHPSIDISIEKTISPAGPVMAGGTVVVQLPTTTGTDSAYVAPSSIVVEDVWRDGEDNDFWNAFNLTAIAPTQVLAGSTMTIDVSTDGGDTWHELTVISSPDGPTVFSGDVSTLVTDAGLGIDVTDITGIRYTFTDPNGFAAGTMVSPNAVFEARSTLRDGGAPTSVPNGAGENNSTTYENLGSAQAEGLVEGGAVVESDVVDDTAEAKIISYTDDRGSLLAGKAWNKDLVSSQSGETASTRLRWGVASTGYSSVTIADPNGGENTPEDTVFQAFDLIDIPRVTFAQDPLLRWDTVSTVELFIDGAWQEITPPGGSWMNADGFTGYKPSAEQSAAATGVRITVVPNNDARANSTDPLAPPVDSGVATSATDTPRIFDLTWKLRNLVRVPGAEGQWASATHGYNDENLATVWNTVGVSGILNGTPVGPRGARDNIMLVDQPPAVSVTKDADKTVIPVPFDGDVAPADYPTVNFTITAENESSSRASYIRVTDPMTCTDEAVDECKSAANAWAADPFAGVAYNAGSNPFERLNLTHIAFDLGGADVSADASQVTLWRLAADGTLSTEVLSVTTAQALQAAALADVVGVSVLYQGASPETTGGTISSGKQLRMTLSTQLRVTERSEPDTVVEPFTVDNYTFAQGYDPVLADEDEPYDVAFDGFELVGGRLDVTAEKTITPSSLLEKDRTTPVGVVLKATDGDATVATNQVVIEDTDQDFWNSFALTALGEVALPAGADQVRVDVQTEGSDTWQEGATGAAAALPEVGLDTVTGIRFVFTRADGGVFSHTAPPAGWLASAAMTVGLRDTLRGTDDPIVFPGSVDNEITTISSRTEDPELYGSATADAADDIQLATGTYRIDVAKAPYNNVHTVEAGQVVPWTLEFTNSGSGYLTVDSLVDQLPAQLTWDGEDPTYQTSDGGTLSTGAEAAYNAADRTIAFTWPAGGQRMAPGETFTITLGLVLEPGLRIGEHTTNQFVVTVQQQLSACTNESGNGQGVLAGLAATECGTSNFVQPIPGASLATYKGVKGEVDGDLVDGAVNTVNPDGSCVQDDEGYYRAPCAAYSVVGASDEWKLKAVNSGTEDYTHLTLVEPLPTADDKMLATGSARGSTYRPVLDGAFGLQISGAPEGTAVVWQVTTDAGVCFDGDTTMWPDNPECSDSTWVNSDEYGGDWADVTGLRATFDFTGTPNGVMKPGEGVKLLYHTVNLPATAEDADRAPVDVPVTDEFAWNQFGAVATLTTGKTLQRAPVKAGVTLLGGPLQVTKAIAGDATGYAPAEFLVDVVCTVAGAPVALGDEAVLRLTEANDHTARINGIPLSADCTVTEQGEPGEFGETSRTGSPATVSILTRDAVGPVAAEQSVTITNVYDFGGLSVTKAIDTRATVGEFGPFDFTLSCVTGLGDPVALTPGDAAFTLSSGQTHTVTDGTIPVGSECEVTETETDGADSVAFTGTAVVDGADASAVVTVGPDTAAVTATNHYEAGTLSVLKTVVGDGAEGYGDGPFTASVTCTYGNQVLYENGSLAIVPDEAVLIDAVFPVGTLCEVEEVLTGGANETENPAAVVITGPEDGQEIGAVTALVTNHFTVGSLDLVKERVGDGVEDFGAGPFQMQVTCTWVKDGETLTVPIANGGLVSLDADNEYRARIDGIIVGAECAVVETDAGLATANRMTPENGIVTILDPALAEEPATVVVTNQFDVGQLQIDKTVDRPTVSVGEDVVYTVTVRNTGQIDAADLTVTDRLPEGATFLSSNPSARVDGRTLTWTIDALAVGAQASFTVTVRYHEAGSYANTATVSNPSGPWKPVDVQHACADNESAACASVGVLTLAMTGATSMLTVFGIAFAVLVMGLLLMLAASRRRRIEQ
ncbi:hypothetical protein GCM10027416_32170 [Okibacterium endophyticum]